MSYNGIESDNIVYMVYNKEEILKFIEEHEDTYVQLIKCYKKEFYCHVNEKYIGKKFGEKLYRCLHENESVGKCRCCGKETRFQSFIVGFVKYCSKKCANISSAPARSLKLTHEIPDPKFWVDKKCLLCKKLFSSLISKNQIFCSSDCSANFIANDENRLKKIRETKLERYGNETFTNMEKSKKTCMERYGVDNISKCKEIKNKIKQTNLEKFGVENASSSQIVKDKRENTLIKRYGHSNPFQIEEIKNKIKIKYKEKFGVEYPTQIEEVRKKIQDIVRKNKYNELYNYSKYTDKVEFLFKESEYQGASSDFKYKVKCKLCGNIFEDHFDGSNHPRCLICYPNITTGSQSEKDILCYIKSILDGDVEIISKDRSVLGNRELDIYIPSLKIAFEYNGLYWHSKLGGKKDKNYHLDKINRCNKKNIRLIQIFEDEWVNKSGIIKSKISHILNVNKINKVYARKCKIDIIPSKLATEFLNFNHIQGSYDNSQINLGLFFEGNLVSVMTFGKLRLSLGNRKSKEGEYEMLRYATSNNRIIVGGCGKLLSYFNKIYKPTKIVSYADKRWSDGNLYKKLGFFLSKITSPNYYYFKPGYAIRYHRFCFRKNVLKDKLELFDPRLTEWQNMQLNGYDRIWDCGNLKYEYKP